MNTTTCQTRKTRHDCQTRKTRHDCQTRKTRHDCQTQTDRTRTAAGDTRRRCDYTHGHLERLPRVYEELTRPHGEPCPLGRWDHRQPKHACG